MSQLKPLGVDEIPLVTPPAEAGAAPAPVAPAGEKPVQQPKPNNNRPPQPQQQVQQGAFVFVNGERCELLEDRRLFVYDYFPVGTELFDVRFAPWRHLPLSTLPDEVGVTASKLVPYGQYAARVLDKATGQHVLVNKERWSVIVVHHLPMNCTAEQIGKYFEQFSPVTEADVLRWPNHSGKTRGYVILKDPEASRAVLAMKHFNFYNITQVTVDGTDTHPVNGVYVPPAPMTNNGSGNNSNRGSNNNNNTNHGPAPMGNTSHRHRNNNGEGPNGNHSNNGNQQQQQGSRPNENRNSNNDRQHHNENRNNDGRQPNGEMGAPTGPHPLPGTQGAPAARALPGGSPSMRGAHMASNNYYMVVHLLPELVDKAATEGKFYTSPSNIHSIGSCLEKGPVFLIILLAVPNQNKQKGELNSIALYLFGAAKVNDNVADLRQAGNSASRAQQFIRIEWTKHSVFLKKEDLNGFAVNFLGMGDGIPLKPEIGHSLTGVIDQSHIRPVPPDVHQLFAERAHLQPGHVAKTQPQQQQPPRVPTGPRPAGSPVVASPTSIGAPVAAGMNIPSPNSNRPNNANNNRVQGVPAIGAPSPLGRGPVPAGTPLPRSEARLRDAANTPTGPTPAGGLPLPKSSRQNLAAQQQNTDAASSTTSSPAAPMPPMAAGAPMAAGETDPVPSPISTPAPRSKAGGNSPNTNTNATTNGSSSTPTNTNTNNAAAKKKETSPTVNDKNFPGLDSLERK